MKKSCFLQIVVIGTIIIAAVIYIVETKFDEWFLEPGKKLVMNEIVKNWDVDMAYIRDTQEKDSLKSLLIFYVDNFQSLGDVAQIEDSGIMNEYDRIIEDSIITDREIAKITSLINKELNEKSKSN